MKIITIPALTNNYSYLIIDEVRAEAAAVDPADPERILQAVLAHGVRLTSLFITHHHPDHTRGNIDLVSRKPSLVVFGSDARIPEISYVVRENMPFQLGSLAVTPYSTPGHTKGSVSYFVTDGHDKALFSGDTLFVAGCGDCVEGDVNELFYSLTKVIATLPPDTNIYPGHEYANKNLSFALNVEPNNEFLQTQFQLARGQSVVVPTTLAQEMTYNPFLRTSEPSVLLNLKVRSPLEAFKRLRTLRDHFG